ncbi:MAG TPA: hypothetical protein VFE62_29675 [Gemmataceae bacterium]|nr:hypothetical protein [Gemmataceae bacterium]
MKRAVSDDIPPAMHSSTEERIPAFQAPYSGSRRAPGTPKKCNLFQNYQNATSRPSNHCQRRPAFPADAMKS